MTIAQWRGHGSWLVCFNFIGIIIITKKLQITVGIATLKLYSVGGAAGADELPSSYQSAVELKTAWQ